MRPRRPAAASHSRLDVFSTSFAVSLALLLLADRAKAAYAATPSPEEVADAFDCASALNDKLSKRDISLNEGLASLSQEGATAAKEEETATLEQDALLHQQLASQAEAQKSKEAKRHQQLMESIETESNRSVEPLKHEVRNVESEERKAKEQLAKEEKTLRKLKDFTEKLHKPAVHDRRSAQDVENLEAAQSRVAYAGKADDLRKLPKGLHGEEALQEAGEVGSTQVDIHHGEKIAEQAKATLEECIRGKTSFLRNRKFLRHQNLHGKGRYVNVPH